MNYIKLYEDFNSDGYEEIEFHQFDEDRPSMDDPAISTNFETTKLENMGFTKVGNRVFTKKYSFLMPGAGTKYNTCTIRKKDDDWYYLTMTRYNPSSNTKYYKCDQFDGLINCLKNECNIT
jgi:hypothetical protein